jgi:hypothetical protein
VAYLDASALDRILKAVGKVPDDLDKQQLLTDLELVAALHRKGVQLRKAPAPRRKRLKRARATANKLMMLLETFSDEVGSSRLRRCRKEIDGLIGYIENVPPKLLTSLGVKEKKSAFVILVGRGLAWVFESHRFGNSGYTKNPDSTFKGPFVDFTKAVLTELGVTPDSGQAIADALRSYRRLIEKTEQK